MNNDDDACVVNMFDGAFKLALKFLFYYMSRIQT